MSENIKLTTYTESIAYLNGIREEIGDLIIEINKIDDKAMPDKKQQIDIWNKLISSCGEFIAEFQELEKNA